MVSHSLPDVLHRREVVRKVAGVVIERSSDVRRELMRAESACVSESRGQGFDRLTNILTRSLSATAAETAAHAVLNSSTPPE